MNSRRPGLNGKKPVSGGGIPHSGRRCRAPLRGSLSHKRSANAKIAAADQAKYIGQRTLFPTHLKFRRLQACRSSRNIAVDSDRAGKLQRNSAAPRLRLQVHSPTPWSSLLDAAFHLDKCKRCLVITHFEIDATIADVNFLQLV